MKKTLTINLNKAVYHIDDDAYETLNGYIERLQHHFSGEEGCSEILDDIEARLAELFTERLRFGMQVISQHEVEEVIRIMGEPEDFEQEHIEVDDSTSPEDTEDEPTPAQPEGERSTTRRLFRDCDNRILGGVASGVAHYLSVDVVWVRVLLVLLTPLWASSVWVYMVLWIIVPVADTAAKRLQMRGEPVTIENIKRCVTEEMDGVSSKVRNSDVGGFVGELLRVFFKFVFFAVGGFIAFIFMIVLFAFGVSFFAILAVPSITLYDIIPNAIASQMWLLLPALLLGFGIPLYLLARVLLGRAFGWEPQSKVVNYVLFALWIVGLVLLAISLGHVIAAEGLHNSNFNIRIQRHNNF